MNIVKQENLILTLEAEIERLKLRKEALEKENKELRKKAWQKRQMTVYYDLFIVPFLKVLSDQERSVLKLRFKDLMTLQEIGNQYQVSRQRAEQVINKALTKILCSKDQLPIEQTK